VKKSAAIQALVAKFVDDLEDLIVASTLDSVSAALSKRPGLSSLLGKATKSSAGRGREREKGAKRSPEEIAQLTDQLHKFILKNPGLRIEQIAEGLGIDTKELVLPIKKLAAAKVLSTKGQKRATRYSAK